MITKFKIFESQNANDYKGKFFTSPVFIREYDWKKEDFYIVLVNDIDFKWKIDSKPFSETKIWPRADCFTVMKDGEIKDPTGWGHHYTQEEFDNIEFMTPIEFYNKYTKLCEELYLKVIKDFAKFDNKVTQYNWYSKTLNFYKETLETVPELRYIVDAEKYNL